MSTEPIPDADQLGQRLAILGKRVRKGRCTDAELIYLEACLDHWRDTCEEWKR